MFLNPASARELLLAGADPNLCGPKGIPPLARALISIHDEDLTLLNVYIEHGATVSDSLLFSAMAPRVRQAELKTRFLLLEKGLNPNVTSEDWGTPLHLAIASGKPNQVKLLLDSGADRTVVSACRKTLGKTPAQVAEALRDPGIRDAILCLLSQESERSL